MPLSSVHPRSGTVKNSSSSTISSLGFLYDVLDFVGLQAIALPEYDVGSSGTSAAAKAS